MYQYLKYSPTPVEPKIMSGEHEALIRKLFDNRHLPGRLTGAPSGVRARVTIVKGTPLATYLDGLADGGMIGAAEIQEAVERFGSVEVWVDHAS